MLLQFLLLLLNGLLSYVALNFVFLTPFYVKLAEELRRSVFEETGLTCSAGVAPNRLLAKVLSFIPLTWLQLVF